MRQFKYQQDHTKATPKLEGWRTFAVLLAIFILFSALLGRHMYLLTKQGDFLEHQGLIRFQRNLVVASERGKLLDRDGNPLAISSPVKSIWVSPAELVENNATDELPKIERILKMNHKDFLDKFKDKKKTFVWLARGLSPYDAGQIMALDIPGVYIMPEYKRFYPMQDSLAPILGSVNRDNIGLEGLELSLNKQLSGKDGSRVVTKNRKGEIVQDDRPPIMATPGQNIELTIDQKIQFYAFKELKNAVDKAKAKSGSVVVMDAHTGEIYAMANYPSFNPHSSNVPASERRNRSVTDTYEPGSIMKPIIISAALDRGLITPTTLFDTRALKVGPATVKDTHEHPSLTVEGIIQTSSNVGSTKVGWLMKPEVMHTAISDAGFGKKIDLKFPGVVAGRILPWKSWKPIEQATISFGHGISVNLLQMMQSYTLFTTDGLLIQPHLIKGQKSYPKQILKPDTAKKMRIMMQRVTEKGGTATMAAMDYYTAAGKTGTARKLENGHYVMKYIASFVGFAPAQNPRLIIGVMIDEPKDGGYYGGVIAGPVFKNIAQSVLTMWNVPHDKEPLLKPEERTLDLSAPEKNQDLVDM